MKFVQHIKAIILLENGGQRNSQGENEKFGGNYPFSHFFK
jgi:hypothetical protein